LIQIEAVAKPAGHNMRAISIAYFIGDDDGVRAAWARAFGIVWVLP